MVSYILRVTVSYMFKGLGVSCVFMGFYVALNWCEKNVGAHTEYLTYSERMVAADVYEWFT